MPRHRSRVVPASAAPALLALLMACSPSAGGGLADLFSGYESAITCRDAHTDVLLSGSLETRQWTADDLHDEETGRDMRNYPPDRVVDHLHMRLEIDIPDMNTPRFSAVETLTVRPIGSPARSMRLNAEGLNVESVTLDGAGEGRLDWSHDGSVIQLSFDPPLEVDAAADLRIEYGVSDPLDGLFWLTEAPEWPGRAAQIHTQGEPETNQHWFACHDFPNERLTTELIVTVPAGYLVSSNGELVSEETSGGRTTFHWRQEPAHVNYLVSLIVGKFDVVDVGDGRLSMPVYVPPGQGPNVRQTYGRTAEMVRVFEERFGHEYPWARYAQLLVWNFGAGGMENTAATTMYDTAVLDARALEDGDLEGLISHELGHQWFGDLITCKSWEHIWLNEGWATYSESLWFEHRDGYDRGYLYDVYNNLRRQASRDRLDAKDAKAGERPGMVSKVYEDPDEVFRRRSNPYPKGGSVMHMLRVALGEEVFFAGVRDYVRKHRHTSAETDDFRRCLEEASGRSLERFFAQWCRRPGAPEVTVSASWDESSKELSVVVEQSQRIDGLVPAFEFDLPIVIIGDDGSRETMEIAVTGKRHEKSLTLPAEPEMVVVDPELHVLMAPTVKQPTKRFIAQLRKGPTVPSRLDAADALSEKHGDEVVDALVEALRDESEFYAVRSAAAEALGDQGEEELLLAVLEDGVANARVRRALVDALSAAGDEGLAVFARLAADESESYGVRSSALRALGEHGDREHLPVVIGALDSVSQHDQVRGAAIRALAALDEPEGLDAVIPFTRFGHLSRLRPTAIGAVADLAEHDPEKAADAIIPLLNDTESRAKFSAGFALVEIGHEKGVAPLRRLASSDRQERMRERAEGWADSLAAKQREDQPLTDLRKDVERLSRELAELKESMEEEGKR